jgi:hypothetical protein
LGGEAARRAKQLRLRVLGVRRSSKGHRYVYQYGSGGGC